MIIDIVALFSLIVCLIIGWNKGIFKMIGRLAVCILALILAFILSTPISSAIFDSFVEPKLVEVIDSKIEEYGATETVATIYTKIQSVLNSDMIDDVKNTIGSGLDTVAGAVQGIDIQEIAGIDLSNLPDLGNNEIVKWITKLGANINTKPFEDMLEQAKSPAGLDSESASSSLVNLFAIPITGIIRNIVFVLLVILINLVGNLLWNLIEGIVFKQNALGTVNQVLGMVCGAVLGFAICLVLGLVTFAVTSGNSDSLVAQSSNSLVGLVSKKDNPDSLKTGTDTWADKLIKNLNDDVIYNAESE